MNAQFAHVSTYARKTSSKTGWSVGQIAGEAGRNPENSPHVQQPLEPVQLVGFPVLELPQRLEDFLATKTSKVNTKAGVKERKVREDAHVLTCSVYSWPEHVGDFDKAKAEAFFRDCIDFHAKEFGAEVQSAVMHLDETHPHIHVYSFHANARADHPGHQAKKEAAKTGQDPEQAYKTAMKGFQDRFFEQVGIRHGLDRLGPKRQRIPRDQIREWKDGLKTKAEALQREKPMLERIDEIKAEGIGLTESLKKTQTELQKAQQDLENRTQQAKVEAEKLERLKVEVGALERNLKAVQAVGGFVAAARKVFYRVLGKDTPEATALKIELKKTEEKAQQKAESLGQLRAEVRELQSQKNQLEKATTKLGAEISDLKQENFELYEEAKAEIDRLRAENHKLKNPTIEPNLTKGPEVGL